MTAAADALYTAQSGVSKQLKALADELGVELFRHEGKRLVGLTPIGEQIDEIAARVLRDTNAIQALGRSARKDAKSQLSVVATRHTANAKVRGAVLRFQRTHPKVLLQVVEERPETACKMVSAGEVDIGVVPEWHVDGARLRVIPLEHWRLVVAARYPGLRFLPTVAIFPPLMTAIIVRRNAPLSWAARDFIELLTEDASSQVLSVANDSRLV